MSHRVLCMPVLNLPCGTRGRFQGVISSCNNISHLLSLLLPFFGAVSCCFSLPNCVLCWWQFGTVIRKVHSFLYLCFFVLFFPCCNQSVPGGLGYLMFPTVQNHRAVIIWFPVPTSCLVCSFRCDLFLQISLSPDFFARKFSSTVW